MVLVFPWNRRLFGAGLSQRESTETFARRAFETDSVIYNDKIFNWGTHEVTNRSSGEGYPRKEAHFKRMGI